MTMDRSHADSDPERAVAAWSRLLNLGITPTRIAEFAPQVTARLASLAELWAVDVEGLEMAVNFQLEEHGSESY